MHPKISTGVIADDLPSGGSPFEGEREDPDD
jgi:hypothetical protein